MSMKLWQCFYIEMLLLYFIVLKLYCFTLLEAKRGFKLKNVKVSTTGLTILIWERNANFVNLNDRGDNIFWTLHCRVQECQCQSLKQLCLLMIPEMTIHYTLYINKSNIFSLTELSERYLKRRVKYIGVCFQILSSLGVLGVCKTGRISDVLQGWISNLDFLCLRVCLMSPLPTNIKFLKKKNWKYFPWLIFKSC